MNALEQVAAVQRATAQVAGWTHDVHTAVVACMPQVAHDHKVRPSDWCVTVQLFAQDWETETMAAERLARYLTLHAERWGDTPTMNALRKPPPSRAT